MILQKLKALPSRFYLDLDTRRDDSTVFISGMGRSGTTWLADLINHDGSYREIFEPFHPRAVPQAAAFEYLQYLAPGEERPELAEAARRILAGRVRAMWCDQFNRAWLARRRIIKDIRSNLMLAWLQRLRPGMPVILLLRHPLAVTASWLRLGWGGEGGGQRSDLDALLAQPRLLQDHPDLAAALQAASPADSFERILAVWCVLYAVPLRQAAAGGVRLLACRYEDLLDGAEEGMRPVFAHLGQPLPGKALRRRAGRASATSYGGRGQAAADPRRGFSARQRAFAARLLASTGLGHLYDCE